MRVPNFRIAMMHAEEALKNQPSGTVIPLRARISPVAAKKLFDDGNYERNRRFDERHADSIAYAMIEGEIDATETLVICLYLGAAILVDGQHRIWAVCQLAEDWEFTINFIKTDTMEEVRHTYAKQDANRRTRSIKDQAESLNLDHQIGVSSRVFSKGLQASKLINTGFRSTRTYEVTRILKSNEQTNATAMDFKLELRAFDRIQKKGVPKVKDTFMNAPSVAVAMIVLRHQPETAAAFWEGILQDDGLKQGDPRKAILDFIRDIKINKNKISASERALYLSMAWNAYYSGRRLTRLKIKDDLLVASGLVLKGTPWDGSKLTS